MTTTKTDGSSWLNVCIIPLQGVYNSESKTFHVEYPDRFLYARHLLGVADIMQRWQTNCGVLSGGYTSRAAPTISEAEGAQAMLSDFGVSLPLPIGALLQDRCSLDSAENVIFGLMTARQQFPDRRIGNILVATAFSSKRRRFTYAAEALGIMERVYVWGAFDTSHAVDPEGAAIGEQRQVEEMVRDRDPLLMGQKWRAKKIARFQSDDYEGRVNQLRGFFPRCFTILDEAASCGPSEKLYSALREAYLREVLAPRR